MATTRNPNISGFESSLTLDIPALKKKLKLNIDGRLEKFNHRAPTVFRAAVSQAISEDSKLSKYAGVVKGLKIENRPFGMVKMGSGLTFRIDQNKMNIRFFLLDRKMRSLLGQDGFYKFKTLTEGEYRYVIKPGVVTPIRVKASDPRARVGRRGKGPYEYKPKTPRPYDDKMNPGETGPTGVFFILSKRKIDRTEKFGWPSLWPKRAVKIALDKLTEEFSKS